MDLMKFAIGLATCMLYVQQTIASPRTYDGDKVLSIEVPNKDVWQQVLNIMNDYIPITERDVWGEPRRDTGKGHIFVPQQYLTQVTDALHKEDIQFSVKIDDVQRLISESNAKNEARRQRNLEIGRHDINGTFPRYADVLTWMQDVVRLYPQLASTFSVGLTLQNRPMQILRLGLGGGNKWRVWLDAGLHAREWLSPTTAIYVADRLIQGYAHGDESIIQILRFFDFDIMPIANPDGYEYCHTGERLWRKNRRPINAECTGVDLNRNFNFQWGGVNADTNPCSNLYMGPSPESEIELRNLVNYIMPNAQTYLMYYAYHTWGELFFTRWDYSGNNLPADHTELFDLAALAVNNINNVHGEGYIAGIAPDLMYPFAGSSSDWARGVANMKYSFLTELRDFSGDYAFVAPPEEIVPCGEENWAGLEAILVTLGERWRGTSPPE